MKTLYDELDVKPDATEKQIKTAFREKAKKFHPDVLKGKEEMFRKVHEAYMVLSDEVLREEYDRTGYYGRSESLISAADIIGTLFTQIVPQYLENPKVDIISTMKNALKRGRKEVAQKIKDIEKEIKGYEGLKKRIVYKGKIDRDLLLGIINSSIINLRRGLKSNQLQLEASKVALGIMKNYEFNNEEFAMQFGGPKFSTTTGTFTWS